MLALALGAQYTNPHLRTAIVAVHPLFLAFGHRYLNLAGPEQVGIFGTLLEARAWLTQPASFHAVPPTNHFVA